MKISIRTVEDAEEITVDISCNRLTPDIERIISMLRMLDFKLAGKKDGETFILEVAQVIYIETVDKKTFLYTKTDIYETNLKLYELEEQLSKADFLRINKSCLMNLRHIVSLKADIERKIQATMSNKEKLIISRQYAEAVKIRLGVK